jgi:hypothetical protein
MLGMGMGGADKRTRARRTLGQSFSSFYSLIRFPM